ncbi:uncharacterized protein MYCFIDRAFT_213326 [Pseudocercospora fijiensis CIRAD86]|uniref:Uncharacterized protein n=1 Tax=Pseudocercospora fijiensis (strain CIRAD86) TaxID=383855 RepID=N1Q7C2_PSEFD|nr:uncharacterized protein MYCFIDRAFT_213326 [Pseudocercospora fijiensis CIRAD86]EME88539.1 hypothetical protein MYCFIDRAFT_213326 [Pseudocercospora fijiensis CIRAD86]
MDKVRVHDEDTAMGSASGSGSDLSNLSALNENETDDLGRRILENQREAQRARQENRPFWRAKPRPRTTIPVETIASTAEESGHQRAASAGSNKSDPPLNVPREWGRRAKRRTDWPRKLDADEELDIQPLRADDDSIFPHRTLYTGDDNPLLSPGGVVASLENTPPSMRRRRQMSSPSSLHHMNTTLQPALDSEDIEFNDASLLVSTPAVNHRNRKIDMLMQREIEVVEKRAVTKRSLETLARRATEDSRPGSAPSGDQARIVGRRRSNLSDKENEPDDVDISKPAEQKSRPARRSQHGRNDSLALLRKLARVSSMSPSPARDKDDERRASGSFPNTSKDDGDKSSEAQTDSRRVRIDGHAKKNNEPDGLDTPAKSYLKKPPKDPRRIFSEPNHPKSALEAVVQDAKEKGDPLLGENTLASLEDIVHPPDATNSTLNFDTNATSNPPPGGNETSAGLTQAEKDRRQEDLALENLNKRLRSTRSTIRDANRGLRRIENRIEAASEGDPGPDRIPGPHDSDYEAWASTLPPYTDHNGRTICAHCGGSYTSVWRGLWVEFRENFYTWSGPKQQSLQLTWLGWTLVIWWIWFVLESMASNYFAYRYDTFFPFVIPTLILRPLAPVWKPVWDIFVWCWRAIFGTTARPDGQWRRPPSRVTTSHTTRVMGGKDWIGAAAKATASATRRIVNSAKQAVDDVGNMWDDEYL